MASKAEKIQARQLQSRIEAARSVFGNGHSEQNGSAPVTLDLSYQTPDLPLVTIPSPYPEEPKRFADYSEFVKWRDSRKSTEELAEALISQAFIDRLPDIGTAADFNENLGIFKHREREARPRVARFLNGLQIAVKDLGFRAFEDLKATDDQLEGQKVKAEVERTRTSSVSPRVFVGDQEIKIEERHVRFYVDGREINLINYDPQEQQNLAQDLGDKKRSFANLARLGLVLEAMMDVSQFDPKQTKDSLDRFRIEPEGRKYKPGTRKDKEKVFPYYYDFEDPAEFTFRIRDFESRYNLVFEIFPDPYSTYGRYAKLDGATPDEAREVIFGNLNNARKRKGNGIDDVEDLVANAESSMRPISLAVSLENPSGKRIAQISGNYHQMQTMEGQMSGFNLRYDGFPKHWTFLPIEFGDPENGANSNGKSKEHLTPPEQLVRDLATLESKV